MSSIMQVQQGLLNRMEQFESLSQGAAIKPAELGVAQPEAGFEGAFEMALRGVDAEQHKASAAMAAVDSGQSEDLVGAMIQSQQASLSFSALLQVRNKLASAFDDIIRMPL